MRNVFLKYVLCSGVIAVSSAVVLADPSPRRTTTRRARPPTWNRANTNVFFRNAFSEALSGNRPSELDRPAPLGASEQKLAPDETTVDPTGKYAWSSVISADTVENEVKAIKQAVDKTVTTPVAYRSGGFKTGRQLFSMLAFLFTIVSEYDDEVRWKPYAVTARDWFARAGRNSKTGTTQSYKEAKQCKADLQELVGGASVASSSAQGEVTWETICERPPLMRRMNIAHQDRIAAWTADRTQFSKNSDALVHEAEIIAAIAAAIQQEGFESWDDEDYLSYCQRLKQHSLELVSAVKMNNSTAARSASGEIAKACSECHELYR